jgi:hypothetical protein
MNKMTKIEKREWMEKQIKADYYTRPNAYLTSHDFYIWDDDTEKEGFYSLRWNAKFFHENWITLEYYSKDDMTIYTLFDESESTNEDMQTEEDFFNFKDDEARFNYVISAFDIDTDEAIAIRKIK